MSFRSGFRSGLESLLAGILAIVLLERVHYKRQNPADGIKRSLFITKPHDSGTLEPAVTGPELAIASARA
jgi:hypothetical protein